MKKYKGDGKTNTIPKNKKTRQRELIYFLLIYLFLLDNPIDDVLENLFINSNFQKGQMDSNKTTKGDKKVITEIPEDLKRLTLIMVKTFYGLDHFVICDYIQKKVIMKEDELRDLCKIDQRQLRKFLVTLKVDKIVKERLVPEEGMVVASRVLIRNLLFKSMEGSEKSIIFSSTTRRS